MLNNITIQHECKFIALFVTDIIKQGSYVYFSDQGKEILEKAFNLEFTQGVYLDGVLSRKLQMVPCILEVME